MHGSDESPVIGVIVRRKGFKVRDKDFHTLSVCFLLRLLNFIVTTMVVSVRKRERESTQGKNGG